MAMTQSSDRSYAGSALVRVRMGVRVLRVEVRGFRLGLDVGFDSYGLGSGLDSNAGSHLDRGEEAEDEDERKRRLVRVGAGIGIGVGIRGGVGFGFWLGFVLI